MLVLVKSVRGAYGGYILANEPTKITSGDIIRVLEGPISPVEGIEDEEPAKRQLWIRIRDAVKDVLDKTTLEDLATLYRRKRTRFIYVLYLRFKAKAFL